MTKAQRRLRTRKRKADANVARARRVVKALAKKVRAAARTLRRRQTARRKIK